jgi:ATP-binding cassette, subfamily B (MDR/TAP), member 1
MSTETMPPPEKVSEPDNQQATVLEVVSRLLGRGGNTTSITKTDDSPSAWYLGFVFVVGWIAAMANGLVAVSMAFLFAESFTDVTGAAANGLDDMKEITYLILAVGVAGFFAAATQTWCFETCAYHASNTLRLQWFAALLRQDAAYFDVYDISGTAVEIGASVIRFRRGAGRKLGEGVQFLTTGIGGIAFGFYSQWKVALVTLALLPFVATFCAWLMELYRTKGARAAASYKMAGSIVYTAVSAIRTVLSLNAVPEFTRQYALATQEAYKSSMASIMKEGFANGGLLSAMIFQYFVLVLFGTWLIWSDVTDTGCDPSGAVKTNHTCDISASEVFGSMLGIAFAAMGIAGCGNSLASFTAARIALHQAQKVIRRRPGSPSQKIHKPSIDELPKQRTPPANTTIQLETQQHSKPSQPREEPIVRAILPAYKIDSIASTGWKPSAVSGSITFQNVSFEYPTRPNEPVLRSLNMEISPGKVAAVVGRSGSGKSTIASLLERFYDPQSGSICIDGRDIREWNVSSLRKAIGYVGQEPMLFAASIRQNLLYGNPDATQDQIEEAARLANAHDFIMSFDDGYNTQVGDRGSQLSGGQKQVSRASSSCFFCHAGSHNCRESLLLASLWETRR